MKIQTLCKRIISLTLIGTLAFSLCGCSGDRKKDQAAYRAYGITCLQDGQYEEAVEAFQRALDQSRGQVGATEIDTCYYKAEAQFLSGDYEGAITTYTAVVDYNGDATAYFLRGCAYFKMEQWEEGLADFRAGVAADDDNYELYIGIYEVLAASQMEGEAQSYLNQALDIRGDKAYDKMQKGRIYLLLGEYDSAIAALKDAVERGNREANYYLGEAYSEYGDAELAEECYKLYLDSGVADSEGLYGMGERRMQKGDYEGALVYFNSAMEMENVTNKQELMRAMIIAYEKSGDFDTAKTMMAEYVELYPADEEAQRENIFLQTR